MDPAKPGESRAAQDVRQHGFRLIVGSVRHGDARQAAFLHEALKKSVTCPPRYVFQIAALAFGPCGDVLSGHKKLQAVPRCKSRQQISRRPPKPGRAACD